MQFCCVSDIVLGSRNAEVTQGMVATWLDLVWWSDHTNSNYPTSVEHFGAGRHTCWRGPRQGLGPE